MKIINNFLSNSQIENIISWVNSINPTYFIDNSHIKIINDMLNGYSVSYDISKTNISNNISSYQGNETIVNNIPDFLISISKRIAGVLSINDKNCFFQAIKIGKDGKVGRHYDASINGYITYKANINLIGPEKDYIYVGKNKHEIKINDLYCFEASLFGHSLEKSNNERIILSYGFIVPYEDLGWNKDEPRIRLSKRINKYFQK